MAHKQLKIHGETVVIDTDAPVADITDDLFDAGLTAEEAEDLALKIAR